MPFLRIILEFLFAVQCAESGITAVKYHTTPDWAGGAEGRGADEGSTSMHNRRAGPPFSDYSRKLFTGTTSFAVVSFKATVTTNDFCSGEALRVWLTERRRRTARSLEKREKAVWNPAVLVGTPMGMFEKHKIGYSASSGNLTGESVAEDGNKLRGLKRPLHHQGF
ncbi:hypothetical protein BGZ63DRAFT_94297 [Mariannaea sp. PMI_226]|nr:hypothetical protein BGZ63DRAFT_94297 [Mariannaea sp. PMI_226]